MSYKEVRRAVKDYLNIHTDANDVKILEHTLPTMPLEELQKAFINYGDDIHRETHEGGAHLSTIEGVVQTIKELRLTHIYEKALCKKEILYDDEGIYERIERTAPPTDELVEEFMEKMHDPDSMEPTLKDFYLRRLASAYLDDVLNPVGEDVVLKLFADKELGPKFKDVHMPDAIVHVAHPDQRPFMIVSKDLEADEAFEMFISNQSKERPHLKDVMDYMTLDILMQKFQETQNVTTNIARLGRNVRKDLSNDQM